MLTHGIIRVNKMMWHAPKFLKIPKGGSQNKITKEKKVGAHSLTHNTLGVGRCVGVPKCVQDELTSKSSKWDQPAQPI
jgi:hypothetical protein